MKITDYGNKKTIQCDTLKVNVACFEASDAEWFLERLKEFLTTEKIRVEVKAGYSTFLQKAWVKILLKGKIQEFEVEPMGTIEGTLTLCNKLRDKLELVRNSFQTAYEAEHEFITQNRYKV